MTALGVAIAILFVAAAFAAGVVLAPKIYEWLDKGEADK